MEDGFYWVRVHEDGEEVWKVAELCHGMDWYFTGLERRISRERILEVDERRIERRRDRAEVRDGEILAAAVAEKDTSCFHCGEELQAGTFCMWVEARGLLHVECAPTYSGGCTR